MHFFIAVLLSAAFFAGSARCDLCDDLFDKDSCTNEEFKNAVHQVTDARTNKIVAEGVFSALEEVDVQPALAYGAPPHWLCDSDEIKQTTGIALSSGTFGYGDTCDAVTGNIRQLVKYTKEKEIKTAKEAQETNKELLATNVKLTKDIQARKTAQNQLLTAQTQVIRTQQQIATKQREVERLNGEIRRLQDQINRDKRDPIKVILGILGGLIGIRDNRQNEVNRKVNDVRNMNTQLNNYQSTKNTYQRQVTGFNTKISTLQLNIKKADMKVQFLGNELTNLRNVEKDLQIIAMEWSGLDEGCEDVEWDLLLFEDLTLAVQEKVEQQAVKLSKLICGNEVN